MPDQSPAPDYVPRPTGSSAGSVIVIIVGVVLLLFIVCGLGLLGVGWFAYRAVEVDVQRMNEAQVQPVDEVQPVPEEEPGKEQQHPKPDTP
jgi:hypothetical protein